ncbi:cell division protein FtsQ [Anaerovirgula multivorans]|uniref:Cell division protein FtsQ n=1 Tax=Anaerovirgula multivorans TaxID=312168 RepID=A0A239CWX8_9FIRM|nr:FtsQ-type POTRA domain-containing protein [Anaerovirgula multivorans]SNS24429.1 cell division protein FtsQ [Anaerovirgula multivorans]
MEYKDIRKEKKIRRRRLKRILTAFFLSIVFLLWGIYYLLQSDLLNLQMIEVHGNIELTEEEIIDGAKLYTKRNILQYNLLEIKENVEMQPFVKEAIIKRKLPKTMIITVREREKYAIIPYMGSFIYIDQDKVVLQVNDDYLSEDLILITGVEFQSFKLGDKADINNPEMLNTAMELIEASRATSIVEMISEINIEKEDYIQLITFDGIEVLLADTIDPAYSMVALKEVLTSLYTREIKNVIVDMRYKGQISIRDREQWEED